MPSTASPFGLRPSYHPSGVIRQEAGTITTGYGTAIYQYAPIRIITDGSIALAAANATALGTFLGVEYTDSNGRRVLTNRWTANLAATEIVAYHTRDQNIVYAIQSSAAVSQSDMGSQANWGTATAGNATTGLSEVVFNASGIADNAQLGLRIVGLGKEPDNAWGDTYTNLLVQIAEHQDVALISAYGA